MHGIHLDRHSGEGLSSQLHGQLARLILEGRLKPGLRLPSTRELARELGIARNLVIEVYEALTSDGCLEARHGSGTYVGRLPGPRPPTVAASAALPAGPHDLVAPELMPGRPDLDSFPWASWLRCLRKVALSQGAELWDYEGPMGNWELRREIAEHLQRTKGLQCEPGQIYVTAGVSHAVVLLATFLREGRLGVLMENPVVSFAEAAFRTAGHPLRPVPVDGQGMRTSLLPRVPKAGSVFVTPSHQFPLGGSMPLARRLELVAYAQRHGLWLIEDDYDGEFRHRGGGLRTLHSLAPSLCVHLGTFSKCMAPALRLGYAVLPLSLLSRFTQHVEALHAGGARHSQAALALFIREGLLRRHILRMRRRYTRRGRLLCAHLRAEFGNAIEVAEPEVGHHLLLRFPGRRFRACDRGKFAEAALPVECASDYAFKGRPHQDCLVLGFGSLPESRIPGMVERLRKALS